MSLTDRSHRSRRSSYSDGALTHVTDDPGLLGASSDGDVLPSQLIRGYDPVLNYQESGDTSFRAAKGDNPGECDNWHTKLPATDLKTASTHLTNSYVGDISYGERSLEKNEMSGLIMEGGPPRRSKHVMFSPAHNSNVDQSLNISLKKAFSLNTVDHSTPVEQSSPKGSWRQSDSLSHRLSAHTSKERNINESLRGRNKNKVSRISLGRDHHNRNISSSSISRSQSSGSNTHNQSFESRSRSYSQASSGNASSRSISGTPTNYSAEGRPLIGRRQKQSKSSRSSRSGSSAVSGSSKSHSSTFEGRAISTRKKSKGLCDKLHHYWANSKKRAQREFRRKERKRQLPIKPTGESCPIRTKNIVRLICLENMIHFSIAFAS